MAVQIGPKIKIEGEKEYRDGINKIIQQSKTLDSEMKKLTSSFDKNGKTLKQNKQQRELLNQQIKTQKDRVSELNGMLEKSAAKYGEADAKTMKWKQAVNEATAELNKMEAELRDMPSSLDLVGQKMQDVGSKMQSIGGKISGVGRTMTTYVTTPLVGAAGAAIKLNMDFEKSMSNVQSVAGASGEELLQLRQAAIDMSQGTVYTATEASEALYYMSLAGWSVNESISALPAVLSAAAAGNMDLGRASDIMTDYMTALQIPVDDFTNGVANAEHFANVLTATMTNSNTDIDMLGETFKYAGTTAGALGFSVEDLSIAAGLMANNGIKASMAGTTLRNIMMRMADPTDKVANAMEVVNVSLDDGEGNMLSFLEIMQDLREGFAGVSMGTDEFWEELDVLGQALEDKTMTTKQYDKAVEELIGRTFGAEEAQKAMYAAQLGGARGMAGLLAIANSTDEEFDALVQAIYGADEAFVQTTEGVMTMEEALDKFGDAANNFEKVGAAEGVARVQMNNLSGDITTLKNNVIGAAIDMASNVDAPLRDFAQGINDLVDRFRELSPEQQETIIKIGAIVAAIGPALMVISGLVSAIGTIGSAIGVVIPIVGAFMTAAAPLLIGGALIAGAVALAMNWDKVKEVAANIWPAITEAWNGIKESFLSAVDEIGGMVAGWGESIQTSVGAAWDTVSAWTSEKWEGIKTTVSTKAEEIRVAAEEKWNAIKEKGGEAWEGIRSTVEEKTGLIFGVVQGKLGEITAAYEEHNGGLDGIVAAGWQAIEEYYTLGYDTLNALTDGKLGEIMGLFQTNLGSLGTKALEWGRDMVNSLVQGISETWDSVKDGAVSLAGKIAGALHFSEPDYGPLSNFHTFMPDMVKLMVHGMDSNAWRVRRAAEGLAEEMKMALPPSNYEYQAEISNQVNGLNTTLAERETNVNVVLGGDAGRMLRVMAVENNKRTRATGYNALGGY